MREVASGDSLGGLQVALENHFAVGERVQVAVCLSVQPTAQQLAKLEDDLRASGLGLHELREGLMTWEDGRYYPAVFLSFDRPAMAPADKVAFWPVMILALGAVAALGYVVYKGGEISEGFVTQMAKIIFPMFLAGGGIWLLSKTLEKRQA